MNYKYLIFFLALYLPFYLPLRFTLPFNITFIQDVIVGVLFYCVLINNENILNKNQNRIDVFMIFFFLYSLALVLIFSTYRGGLTIFLQHMHTFITGIFMYFSVRYLLNKKDFETLLNIYKYTAIIISILYTAVWINVNLLDGSFPSWVIEYNNQFGTATTFLNKGWTGFYRPMGIIGYSHATGIFLSGALAVVYTKNQINYNRFNSLILLLLFLSIILTASRTAILSVLIIFLFDFSQMTLKYKFKNIFKFLLVGCLVFFLYISYFETKEITLLFSLLSSSFSSSGEINYSIFDAFFGTFFRDIQQINLIFNSFPTALLTGAGFPIYNDDQIINPVLSNDVYFVMWISQYGIIGSLIMFICLVLVFRRLSVFIKNKKTIIQDRIIAISVYRVLLIYLFSTIHSSSIQMYPIYFSFFSFIGFASYMTSNRYIKENTF